MEPGVSDSELRERKRSCDVANGSDLPPGCSEKPSQNGSSVSETTAANLLTERRDLVLWRRPLTTLYYFVCELFIVLRSYGARMLRQKLWLLLSILLCTIIMTVYYVNGPHQRYVSVLHKQFVWCSYWVGLGILSSVGLGTGLHTFILYLGPHIAAVTLAAFECMSVNFPEPPYPDDIICPDTEEPSMSLWTIMSKVRLEAFMWGAGTAIGELPPYFMARAARLSGDIDEEERELEELMQEQHNAEHLGLLDRGKIFVHNLVQKVGFFGILLCASIPNPLFDLAGITCGHFLVPFGTFFGATLIGKAVIKMHIQKVFVVFIFSERHVEQVVKLIRRIPHFGPSLQAPFEEYLRAQKAKLHHKQGVGQASETSWLSWLFEKVVMVMVVYFVISIIHSMAQSYHKYLTTAKPRSPSASGSKTQVIKQSSNQSE